MTQHALVTVLSKLGERIRKAQERRRRNQMANLEAFVCSFEHRRPLPKQRFVAARIRAKWERGEIA